MLRRLYRKAMGRRHSAVGTGAGTQRSQMQLMSRLARAGVNIPASPNDEVAFFRCARVCGGGGGQGRWGFALKLCQFIWQAHT